MASSTDPTAVFNLPRASSDIFSPAVSTMEDIVCRYSLMSC